MIAEMKQVNYEKSNAIFEIPNLRIARVTKFRFQQLREQKSITPNDIQKMAELIFADLGLPMIPVYFKGRRPYEDNGRRTTKEIHGIFLKVVGCRSIQVYAITAKRRQAVKPKTALTTLIHNKVSGNPHPCGGGGMRL